MQLDSIPTPFAATVLRRWGTGASKGGPGRTRGARQRSISPRPRPRPALANAVFSALLLPAQPVQDTSSSGANRASELPPATGGTLHPRRRHCAVLPFELRERSPALAQQLYRCSSASGNVSGRHTREGYLRGSGRNFPDLRQSGPSRVKGRWCRLALWLHHRLAYYHLGASNPAGLRARAMLRDFRPRPRSARLLQTGGHLAAVPGTGMTRRCVLASVQARLRRGRDHVSFARGSLTKGFLMAVGAPNDVLPRYRGSPSTGE